MVRDRELGGLASRMLQALTPTLREVALHSGLNYATLRAWKAGIRSPSAVNATVLADIADAQADRLRGLAVELRALDRSEDRYG